MSLLCSDILISRGPGVLPVYANVHSHLIMHIMLGGVQLIMPLILNCLPVALWLIVHVCHIHSFH